MSFPIYRLLNPSVTDGRMLHSPTVIVDSSLSPCWPVRVCLLHFSVSAVRHISVEDY